jgi:hypothetical protein
VKALFLLLVAWLLAPVVSRAAIVHVVIPESEQLFAGLGAAITQDFDFNADGKNDLRFGAGGGGAFTVIPLHSEAGVSVSFLFGNGFLGTTAKPFHLGGLIERYTEIPGEIPWEISPGGLGNLYTLSYRTLAGTSGIWAGLDAYIGFALIPGDDFNFGWLHIREFSGFGAYFLEYAYETEVNKPINAGQIPEPGTATLLLLATFHLTCRKQRRAGKSSPSTSGTDPAASRW